MAAAKQSAGLLMYRRTRGELEVLLAHPGGPLYARKDAGVWTIPKGEPEPNEALLACARREFEEETDISPEARAFLELGAVRQAGGKVVHAWAFEGEWDGQRLGTSHFELEWPPKSGKLQRFPEVDRLAFFSVERARAALLPAQVAFLDRLIAALER